MKFNNPVRFISLALALGQIACTPQTLPPWSDEAQTHRALAKGAEQIGECRRTTCQRLDLYLGSLDDYTVLNYMLHVDELVLGLNSFEKLSEIVEMSQLEELNLFSTQVSDFSLLPTFSNLTKLEISSPSVEKSYASLSQMRNLKELKLDAFDSHVGIPSAFSLTNLETLIVRGKTIDDISPLAGHPSITNLFLGGNLPVDLSQLLTMPSLQSLTIHEGSTDEVGEQVLQEMRVKGVEVNIVLFGSARL